MAETTLDSAPEPVPGTSAIREVRPDPGSDSFRFCTEMGGGGGAGDRSFGIRKVGLRAEIDTSPPFGSVKEAVTRFGGSGPWLPPYKLGNCDPQNGVDEGFDIKKAEEQAAQLEKDLIVKELEALDVLEELGATKKIVEEIKLQIQKESLKSNAATPVIRERNREHRRNRYKNRDQIVSSSPDLILMELKQAKFNLGKTMNDLGVIRTSVESLNKKAEISRENLKMRWVAGRKMEEAAMAAEALAFAESTSGFFLPEPEKVKTQDESNISKLAIIQKMLEEAAAEVKYSKQAMEEALNRVETANRKQLAAGEALRRWAPQDYCYYYNHGGPNSPANQSPDTVSMRDILGRKQVVPEAAEGQTGRRKVALSEMLQELREDIRFPRKAEAVQCDDDHHHHQKKHLFSQRRKFGFIHVSLPLTKQSKKKNSSPGLNMIQ